MDVFVFDWFIWKYERFLLVCLSNNFKLACDLKSLSRNVIMQVLFSAAAIVLVPV